METTVETNEIKEIQDEISRLEKIENELKEKTAKEQELENAAKLAEWIAKESELKTQLDEVKANIRNYKNAGKVKKTVSDPNAPKKTRGKGFKGVNVEELIISTLSTTGTRMRDVVQSIKDSKVYDGDESSIPSLIGTALIKMAKTNKIKQLSRGLYAPLDTVSEDAHDDFDEDISEPVETPSELVEA